MTAKKIKEDEAEEASQRMTRECETDEVRSVKIKLPLPLRTEFVNVTLVKETLDGN